MRGGGYGTGYQGSKDQTYGGQRYRTSCKHRETVFFETVVGKGSFVKGVSGEIMKESMLYAIEELLDKAVDKAMLGKVSLSELQERRGSIDEEKKNG